MIELQSIWSVFINIEVDLPNRQGANDNQGERNDHCQVIGKCSDSSVIFS